MAYGSISGREGRTSDVAATEATVEHVLRDVHEARGNARFSLFKWFKRSGNRESTVDKRRKTTDKFREHDGQPRSVTSSVESVDTFYSTTTVRSFAFHAGTLGRCDGLALDVLDRSSGRSWPVRGRRLEGCGWQQRERRRGCCLHVAHERSLPQTRHHRQILAAAVSYVQFLRESSVP